MARLHARSWRAAYAGLLPGEVIEGVATGEADRAARFGERIAGAAPGMSWFVAEQVGQVVGFVASGPSRDADASPDTGEVFAIYLDPDVVGRGIGRALMDAAIGALGAHGFAAATLWVLENNARARRFYEVAGWQPDGATKTDARVAGAVHEVRYRRDLTEGEAAGSG